MAKKNKKKYEMLITFNLKNIGRRNKATMYTIKLPKQAEA